MCRWHARRTGAPPWCHAAGDEHVDDLPGLIDCAVDVAPPAGDLHIRLVDAPAGTDRVPAGTCGVSQQRRESLHPAVNADVVDLDTSLGEQLFDVAIGQAVARVPADRKDDDVGWEAEAREG